MLELPDKSPLVWNKFFEENKALVYRYIVRQVRQAIRTNSPRADLFKFTNMNHEAFVLPKNYLKTLQDALKVFVNVEDYESASMTKQVLDEYHINKLITESK